MYPSATPEQKRSTADLIASVYIPILLQEGIHLRGTVDEDSIIEGALDFAARYIHARDEKFKL
jgi:hypothetical protein